MTEPFDPTAVAGKATRGPSAPSASRKQKAALASTSNDVQGVAADQLLAFVERIERLEEEKKTIADDIKEVYGEAKGNGFDVKVLRRVIALRKQDMNERLEFEAVLDLYLHALGMTPAEVGE